MTNSRPKIQNSQLRQGSAGQAKLTAMRHSCAHLLAAAVKKIFPGAKFAIGPVIENGFYYDFDLPRQLTPADLGKIEKEMVKIASQNFAITKTSLSRQEAIKKEKYSKQSYKLELINDLSDKKLTYYTLANFADLCRGPHVKNTKEIGPFKLLSLAGAYWKGSEENPMLQRIYGTCFPTQKELDAHLKNLEEAEKRDHRVLGRTLDLFSLPEEVGAGLPVWHPKGAILRGIIEDFWKKEHQKRGYQLVYTPHIGSVGLWKKSGHWDFYRENMYSPIKIDKQEYLLKPMNCPFHIMIFKQHMRSYRDLPIRYAELGTVYRYERSGVLGGLTRVRGFTQDDAHIFLRPDQLQKEIENVLDLATLMMKTFGFSPKAYLSTKPQKSLGSPAEWKRATSALEGALKSKKISYEIDPGEGVFYGPKIDIKIADALDREWQGPTIQVDFNFPQKFDIAYIDESGKKQHPIMVHRTVLGSMERFVGILIEHFAGAFPAWLSPTQAVVIPISTQKHLKYAKEVLDQLISADIRAETDSRNESVSKKIRDAEIQKVPYMIVVGDKEVKSKTINVRFRDTNRKQTLKPAQFIKTALTEITNKK